MTLTTAIFIAWVAIMIAAEYRGTKREANQIVAIQDLLREARQMAEEREEVIELFYKADEGTMSMYVPEGASEAVFPYVGSAYSSGFDVMATESVVLNPGQRRAVGTGLQFQIPNGYEIQVRPRSGLALKHGITVLNTPGTIDQDYTGEIKVILYNADQNQYTVQRGDRIAQLVLSRRAPQTLFTHVEQLSATERGEGGFGSSGK